MSDTDWENEIVDAEREALFKGDIPRFSLETDGQGIYLEENLVSSDIFDATGVERVQNRVKEMSAKDKTHQQGLIRACLGRSSPSKRGIPE